MATIFAVSSGRPPAAIAVLRISGTGAVDAARRLTRGLPPPRVAGLRGLRDASGRLLDRALVLVFPGPDSATGEDLVELHCHGGRAVVAAVGRALAAMDGLREALPGEFTRRALENGRIDLIEAEGLADLLEAETEAQRVAALSAAEGRVSQRLQGWMDAVALLSARVEASIDYAEEGDVDDDATAIQAIVEAGHGVAADMASVLDAPPVERVRDGIRVVIAGPPNSGKSTLLNLLAERDAAIVSAIPGTTRDRVEVPVQRNGIAYLLTDTAGLRDTDDAIETIGIERAEAAIVAADVVIWLSDDPPPTVDGRMLWIHARADLPDRGCVPPGRVHAVAAWQEASIEGLWTLIEAETIGLLPTLDQLPLKTRQRQQLWQVSTTLGQITGGDAIILAEDLRQARSGLASVLGLDATDTMLGALFSRFCLGK